MVLVDHDHRIGRALGQAVDRVALVTDDLDDLLNRLEPVAASLNCADELARVSDIYTSGGSYQRQRRVAEENDAIRDARMTHVKEVAAQAEA